MFIFFYYNLNLIPEQAQVEFGTSNRELENPMFYQIINPSSSHAIKKPPHTHNCPKYKSKLQFDSILD